MAPFFWFIEGTFSLASRVFFLIFFFCRNLNNNKIAVYLLCVKFYASSLWFFILLLKTEIQFLFFFLHCGQRRRHFWKFMLWCFIYFHSPFLLRLWAIGGHINWASVAVYKALIASSNNGLPCDPISPLSSQFMSALLLHLN